MEQMMKLLFLLVSTRQTDRHNICGQFVLPNSKVYFPHFGKLFPPKCAICDLNDLKPITLCVLQCWISIYYVNLGLRGRIIPPAESCNWNGFIDIKASQWKIGLYTGRAGGGSDFRIFKLK